MPFIPVSWTLFKSPSLWDKFNLNSVLNKGDQLFKIIGKFNYFGMGDLPQELLIENCSVNLEFYTIRQKKLQVGIFAMYHRCKK